MPDPPRQLRRLATDVEQETARALGIIARELGNIRALVAEVLERMPEDQRDSSTELSLRPGHARVTMNNANGWTVVAVVALLVAGIGVFTWVWSAQRASHELRIEHPESKPVP